MYRFLTEDTYHVVNTKTGRVVAKKNALHKAKEVHDKIGGKDHVIHKIFSDKDPKVVKIYRRNDYNNAWIRENPSIKEGIVYSDTSEPFSHAARGNLSKINPNKAYKTHLENHHYLHFIQKNSKDAKEKIQCTKEIGTAERKMEYWKRHPDFSKKQQEADHAEVKKKWTVKENTMSENTEQLNEDLETHVVHALYSDKSDRDYRIHPGDHTAWKSKPSKVFSQRINVKARDKHHAINRVGTELAQKGMKIHSLTHKGLKEEVELAENNKFAPKKLKDIVEKPSKKTHEYKGNTEDEKAIVAKYDDNTVLHPDRNGNGDDVFKASKIDRAEKDVAPGEDEKKYNAWNNGSETVKEDKDRTESVYRKKFNFHNNKALEHMNEKQKAIAQGASMIKIAHHSTMSKKHQALADNLYKHIAPK